MWKRMLKSVNIKIGFLIHMKYTYIFNFLDSYKNSAASTASCILVFWLESSFVASFAFSFLELVMQLISLRTLVECRDQNVNLQ